MSDDKMTLMQKFKAMPAGQRTGIVGGAIVLGMFVVGTIFTEDAKTTAAKPGVQKESLTVFNPGNTNATENVAANLEATNKRNAELEQKVKLLEETNRQEAAKNQSTDGQWSEVSNLVAQVQAMQEQMNAMRSGQALPPATAPKDKGFLANLLPKAAEAVPAGIPQGSAAPTSPEAAPAPLPAPVSVIQVVGEGKKAAKTTAKKEAPTPYLTAGAFFEGELLNGMDASTAIGANRNPTPALLRVKSEAVLPNMANFDVRECFVMLGGFGNISTERVEMRTDTMSCVSEKGEIYEGKIEGYIVGEDGKAGARGRVVSKQGALLAKSFMAGFVGGIGSAFQPQPVQSLNLGGASSNYQFPNTDQVLGGAMSSGLNKSTTALQQFYIKLAEQMFPVVELDAGRKMTVILLKGSEMKMEKKG